MLYIYIYIYICIFACYTHTHTHIQHTPDHMYRGIAQHSERYTSMSIDTYPAADDHGTHISTLGRCSNTIRITHRASWHRTVAACKAHAYDASRPWYTVLVFTIVYDVQSNVPARL